MRKKGTKKKKPLQRLTINAILMVSASLLLIVGSIGFALNIATSIQGYKRETTHSLEFALSILDANFVEYICDEVRSTYDQVESEGLDDPFSKEYMDRFAYLINDDFWVSRAVMEKAVDYAQLDSVAIVIPDEERHRIIYVIDGYDLEHAYAPGQWIRTDIPGQDSLETIEKIASSDASMIFGYGDVNGWIATNYVKLYDKEGNFIAYVTGDIYINDFVKSVARNFIFFLLALLMLVILTAVIISFVAKRNIIDPINLLAESAYEYTKRDKTAEEVTETFFENRSMGASLEMDTLGRTLSDMEKDINETMRRIREMTSEKERLSAEMSLATNIQAGVLKTDFPAYPDRHEFDIFASMTPAKEVGGDLYDFFLIDDDHLCMVVGDVAGKSVPAALFMMITTIIIRNVATMEKSVSQIMKKTNQQLCRNNKEFLFVTVWLGVYTISERKLTFANAGHENPVIFRKSEGEFEFYITKHDPPLGIDEDMEFSEDTVDLAPGDKFFVYTDGVVEVTRGDDVLYGNQRLLSCLNANASLQVKELLGVVEGDVGKFIEGAPQFDDLTMLCLEVLT